MLISCPSHQVKYAALRLQVGDVVYEESMLLSTGIEVYWPCNKRWPNCALRKRFRS
jgi:hypothetical protein